MVKRRLDPFPFQPQLLFPLYGNESLPYIMRSGLLNNGLNLTCLCRPEINFSSMHWQVSSILIGLDYLFLNLKVLITLLKSVAHKLSSERR